MSAIALGDVAGIALAIALALLARAHGLPPLVGFLATGIALNLFGPACGEVLQKLTDLGIVPLLSTVGLKLNIRILPRPRVWAVGRLHMSITVVGFATEIHLLAVAGAPFVSGLGHGLAVWAHRGGHPDRAGLGRSRLHGSLGGQMAQYLSDSALGADSAATIADRDSREGGHGELLLLYSLLLALGGAEAFELVGVKVDMGALVLGIIIASHDKADEVAEALFGFKNLFLLGFFLSIGLSGPLTSEALLAGAAITPLVLVKAAVFFYSVHGIPAPRPNFPDYSEFGLIVTALGIAGGWLDSLWLIVLAIALSLSCAFAAVLNGGAHRLYRRFAAAWMRLERSERVADDRPLDLGSARIAIVGIGRIGTAAYKHMHVIYGDSVVGLDFDPHKVRHHQSAGRSVFLGDPRDGDFWDRVCSTEALDVVMLALPNRAAKRAGLDRIREPSYGGQIAAAARFPDEIEEIREAGASILFNLSAEAGSGFAKQVAAVIPSPGPKGAGSDHLLA